MEDFWGRKCGHLEKTWIRRLATFFSSSLCDLGKSPGFLVPPFLSCKQDLAGSQKRCDPKHQWFLLYALYFPTHQLLLDSPPATFTPKLAIF